MSFDVILRDYLSALQALVLQANSSGEFTPELSYRPVMDTLFVRIAEEINTEIGRVFEPRNQSKAGRPDWRFYNQKTLGVYGYVEAKGLDLDHNLVIEDNREQIDRYLVLGHMIILTDGLEFVFFSPGVADPIILSIVRKPAHLEEFSHADPNPLLENQFRSFFLEARSRRCSEEQIVEEAAKRAVALSSSIADLVGLSANAAADEIERNTITALNGLKEIVENHHDPTLRNLKFFADFVSQVLVFGLLYAHRVVSDPSDKPVDRYEKITRFWSDVVYAQYSEPLYPFRAILDLLGDELGTLGPVGTWYEDCALFLAYIDLEDQQVEIPDYHQLFERFLAVFDPKTRFDFGAFYTPRELAKYTVNLVKDIVKSELGSVELFDSSNKLIDPCCGTGTFLEQLIISSEGPSLPQIVGFEILPAPYALAHYRVSMLTSTTGYPHNLNIILTNTLSDELERQTGQQNSGNILEQEQIKARECAMPPLTLVIGNPPSSDRAVSRSEGNLFSIIQYLLEDFRPPKGERSARQNTQKQIQNEFMKFLRWACNKLLQSKPGILAFVLPSSFSEQTSYKYARRWLVDNFSRLWILDIDRDGRSGVRTSNLFNTLQGRSLIIAFTGFNGSDVGVKDINYYSISDLTRMEKFAYLEELRGEGDYAADFVTYPLDANLTSFRPIIPFDDSMYSRFWPLYPGGITPSSGEAYVFARQCSGVKLAPSNLFIHPNSERLLRKLRDISNQEKTTDELMRGWFLGQAKPPSIKKITPGVRNNIGAAIEDGGRSIVRYAYRPFVDEFALISESVLVSLSKEGGGGTRYRPEIIAAFENPHTLGISISPAPKDIDSELNRFSSFCWAIPDNDLSARGNGRVFCNSFPEYKKKRDWDRTVRSNINPRLLEMLSEYLSLDVDDIVFYVYGILCSNSYLDEFGDFLFTVLDSEQRPRIPFPASDVSFKRISELGKKLAYLEKPGEKIDPVLRGELINSFLSAFAQPFRLFGFSIQLNTETVKLYDENMNILVELNPVPSELLRFRVSGYDVVHTWLKFHSYAYTRSDFTGNDFDEFLDLLYKIQEQMQLIAGLDEDVLRLISGDIPLLDYSPDVSES